MEIMQELQTLGELSLLFNVAFWFIKICIIGFILKHFIREGIKEALDDCGLSKRKTDTTW